MNTINNPWKAEPKETVEHRHLTDKRDYEAMVSLNESPRREFAEVRLFLLEGIIKLCSEAKEKNLCCYEDACTIITEII